MSSTLNHKDMKLLVDTHCFDYGTAEGVNTYICGLYTALTNIAPDIDFYFAAHNIQKIKGIFGEGDNVHYVPLTATNKLWRLTGEMPSIVKRLGIDAAHYQYNAPLTKGNCKTIVTTHDILFEDFPGMFPLSYRLSRHVLFRRSARAADLLLTVSDYSRQRIAHHYGIPAEDIHVTPNAVAEDFYATDIDAARQFVRGKGIDKYVLYVSRIEPRKNQMAVMRAFLALGLWQKGYHLVFVGRKTLHSPQMERYYANLSRQEKEKIIFVNQAPYQELKMWYCAAALFVYPALAEGFGIPPLEAGASGVPCVCSHRTAMGDYTFFGDNLIDIEDQHLLTARMDAILSGREPVDTAAVRDAIRERYNWHAVAANYRQLLDNLI